MSHILSVWHCQCPFAVNPPTSKASCFQGIVQLSKEVERKGTLLKITYQSVSDYLFYLRALATALQSFGAGVLFYLAAAVSDFYIPQLTMVSSYSL